MKPYLFINPKAGLLKGCKTAAQVKEQLKDLEVVPDITIGRTTSAIKKFITKVKREKPTHVYIAGGDGTLATIFKGLMNENLTFGIIPTGSMNNIAGSIGIGDALDDAVSIINRGKVKPMDLGKINGEIFIESVGIGLIANIMNRIGEQDSKKEVMRVVQNSIVEIITTDTVPVELTTDAKTQSIETVWLTVTNTGRAAAAQVDPSSSVHDKKLEVVYCEPVDIKELGRYALAYIKNSHIKMKKFHRIRAQNIQLGLPPQVQIHVDGELRQWRKVKIEILPAAIKVLVP